MFALVGIQTEILNTTCFNLKGEGKTKKRQSVASKLSNPNNFFQISLLSTENHDDEDKISKKLKLLS